MRFWSGRAFQTREFEERFIQIGLPYRVVGAKFYERQEIRDAIAYMRVIAQPADDLAFERIINTPRRGIGNATVQTIHQLARAEGLPMLAAAEKLITTDELKPAAKRSLGAIVNMFIGWRQDAGQTAHTELTMRVLDESGYTEMWQKEKTPDAEGRLENLKELVGAMENFDNLEGFLEHISLVMDGDNTLNEGEVTLMTLHAAKGLEFDVVFLPGWEDGIFPSQRTLDEKGGSGLEEERRLAYVGITRARRRLFISYASSRRVHGLWQSAVPCRFFGNSCKKMCRRYRTRDDQRHQRAAGRRTSPNCNRRPPQVMGRVGNACRNVVNQGLCRHRPLKKGPKV